MRYLSVCSGIEAASCAWHPLGWHPVAFSEIERFPSAVLGTHFPGVPNLGDMNQYRSWTIERGSIDVLVGGTPCQSFSVAGLRKGMADPRGNLALVYLGVADHLRPRWIVWENVPGVLSSNKGRDFGSFLGALGKLGYGWAYRVLDAKHFGVPQRRRRVFVVGYLGDWRRAAAVLFERESLRGDSAPSRSQRKEVAKTLRGRAQASHREDSDNYIAGALTGRVDRGGANSEGNDNHLVSHTLTKRYDSSEDGCGRGVTLVAHSLNAKGGSGRSDGESETFVAFDCKAGGKTSFSVGDIPGALRGEGHGGGHSAIAFSCKDHGADAGDVAPTLRSMGHDASHPNAGGQVAIAYQCQGSNVGQMGTLRAGNGNESGGVPFVTVAFAENSRNEVRLEGGDGQRTGALSTGGGKAGQGIPMIAQGVTIHGTHKTAKVASYSDTAGSLRTKPPGSQENSSTTAVQHGNAVRRLTPVECERLQGFPDNWTLITYRGKQAKDGPRYKAIGNSMAVPVMRWIGQRIAQVEGLE